ncbi:MAG TPA: hypothetical protein P5048_04040, partial [Chlamydiales bacterium]|nr:hypothetical protein [Chlamydiales bacterium]
MVDARIFQRKYSYQNTWVLWNQSGSSKMMMVMNKIFAVQLCFFETIVNFVKCLSNYIIYPIVYKIEVLCSKQNQIVLQEKIKKEISIKRDTESSSMEENDSIETDEEGWIVETVSDKTETEDES